MFTKGEVTELFWLADESCKFFAYKVLIKNFQRLFTGGIPHITNYRPYRKRKEHFLCKQFLHSALFCTFAQQMPL